MGRNCTNCEIYTTKRNSVSMCWDALCDFVRVSLCFNSSDTTERTSMKIDAIVYHCRVSVTSRWCFKVDVTIEN